MFDCLESLTSDYNCTVTFVSLSNITVYYQETEFYFSSWEDVMQFHQILMRSVIIDKTD